MTNESDSKPNLRLAFSPPRFIFPTFLPEAGPSTSSVQNPKKKRPIDSKKDGVSASTSSLKPISRRKLSKKPDPAAPKITHPCTECGKKFWSWKALFGHMRCHPERKWRGINPPNEHQKNISMVKQLKDSWVSVMSDGDHEVAASLLMLVNGDGPNLPQENDSAGPGFDCGGCKKVFWSHQALGRRRASHKNVKGCFENRKCGDSSEVEDNQAGTVEQNRAGMMMSVGNHKCSVCLREFSSGQALGGHMRCHLDKIEETSLLNQMRQNNSDGAVKTAVCRFDLNLPAPVEHSSSSSSSESSGLDLRLGF